MSQPSKPPRANNVNFLDWILKYGFVGSLESVGPKEAFPTSKAEVPEVL